MSTQPTFDFDLELKGPGTSHFDGPAYEPKHDFARLTGQIRDIYQCMKDKRWRTLDEIHQATGHPHASISAQLRHLRKVKFGENTVDKRSRGDRGNGLYEYRLIVNNETAAVWE